MKPKKICSYCKKTIAKNQVYGILCASGLLIHNGGVNNCWEKAFLSEKKTIQGFYFNLKNNLLAWLDKAYFTIAFYRYMLGHEKTIYRYMLHKKDDKK